jgi:hypothetical protein
VSITYIDVPGIPGLRVACRRHSDAEVFLWYTGMQQTLIAAGIVPASTLAPFVPGAKRGKVDADGDRVHVDRYFGTSGGVPVPRARVMLRKPLVRARRLPGAVEAIVRYLELVAKHEARVHRYNIEHGCATPEGIVGEAIVRAKAGRATLH